MCPKWPNFTWYLADHARFLLYLPEKIFSRNLGEAICMCPLPPPVSYAYDPFQKCVDLPVLIVTTRRSKHLWKEIHKLYHGIYNMILNELTTSPLRTRNRIISIRRVSLPVRVTFFANLLAGSVGVGGRGNGVTPSWPMEVKSGIRGRVRARQKAPEGVTK